jgi:hypothetical protein
MANAGSFLLGMRARAMAYAFPAFGMAAMGPHGPRPGGFVDFMQEPPGAVIVCLGLCALGLSVEELGTVARIRAGIAMRLAAAAGLVLSIGWFALRGAAHPSLSILGWALILPGVGAAAYGALFDLAAYRDPRHGQPLRLEKLSAEGLLITAGDRPVRIPAADITSVTVAESLAGKGVLIGVRAGAAVRQDGVPLPWVMTGVDEDRFALTEHQAGLDAATLVQRIQETAQATRGFRAR